MSKIHWGKSTYGMMRYMRMISPGHYRLEWQGDVVEVKKHKDIGYHRWYVYVNREFKYDGKTFNEALGWVSNVWGNEPVETYNMLNRKAGPLTISRKERGGCCDPATETYWSM